METSNKFFFTLMLAPLLAHGQIYTSSTGISPSLDGGIRYAAPEYDADAAAYFTRAGVTDATAKRQISDFVRGVKSLGLWDSMVCWPMRSSQNAGAGMTVHSLGGLGLYSGTLINGPTWGSDGVAFVGALGTRMTSSSFPPQPSTDGLSLMLCFAGHASQSEFASIAMLQGGSYATAAMFILRGNGTNIRFQVVNATSFVDMAIDSTSPTFKQCFAYGISGAPISGSSPGFSDVNGANASYSWSVDRVTIGSRDTAVAPAVCFTGKVAFACAFFDSRASTQRAALFSLYKSTLGQGLGLP